MEVEKVVKIDGLISADYRIEPISAEELHAAMERASINLRKMRKDTLDYFNVYEKLNHPSDTNYSLDEITEEITGKVPNDNE